MKFLKNNKGAILFYLIILVSSLVIINDVKKDNLREENKYVMTYIAKYDFTVNFCLKNG